MRNQLLIYSLLALCFVVGFAWADLTYQGKVVSVTDGDTIKILVHGEQIKVRLSEIDTPEKGQPWGRKPREALAEKVAKQNLNVDEIGRDRYGRVIGKVWLGDRYINRELVQEGHAWAYRKYLQDETLLEDEAAAREAKLGLWSLPEAERVPPWEWRQRYFSKPFAVAVQFASSSSSSSDRNTFNSRGASTPIRADVFPTHFSATIMSRFWRTSPMGVAGSISSGSRRVRVSPSRRCNMRMLGSPSLDHMEKRSQRA